MVLLEQLSSIVIEIFVDFFGEMLQELIHFLAFMLHDLVSDVRCSVIGFVKLMISSLLISWHLLW